MARFIELDRQTESNGSSAFNMDFEFRIQEAIDVLVLNLEGTLKVVSGTKTKKTTTDTSLANLIEYIEITVGGRSFLKLYSSREADYGQHAGQIEGLMNLTIGEQPFRRGDAAVYVKSATSTSSEARHLLITIPVGWGADVLGKDVQVRVSCFATTNWTAAGSKHTVTQSVNGYLSAMLVEGLNRGYEYLDGVKTSPPTTTFPLSIPDYEGKTLVGIIIEAIASSAYENYFTDAAVKDTAGHIVAQWRNNNISQYTFARNGNMTYRYASTYTYHPVADNTQQPFEGMLVLAMPSGVEAKGLKLHLTLSTTATLYMKFVYVDSATGGSEKVSVDRTVSGVGAGGELSSASQAGAGGSSSGGPSGGAPVPSLASSPGGTSAPKRKRNF